MLTTTHADGITTIALDDGKANAMSADMLGAIDEALDEAEQADEVVLLVGRSGTFSGGYDLGTFLAGPAPLHQMLLAGANLATRMIGFPTPIVSACTGHAVAMGSFLLLASDRRVGAEGSFRLGANEVRIRLAVPAWTIELARDRINPARSALGVLTGELVDPVTAVDVGYLDEVVDPDRVVERAHEIAKDLTSIHLPSYRATKAKLRTDLLRRMRSATDVEVTLEQITLFVQEAAAEQ